MDNEASMQSEINDSKTRQSSINEASPLDIPISNVSFNLSVCSKIQYVLL